MKPSEKFWGIIVRIILTTIGLTLIGFMVYYWQVTLNLIVFFGICLIFIYLSNCIHDIWYYPDIEKHNQRIYDDLHPDCKGLFSKYRAEFHMDPKYNFLWRFNDWLNRNYKEESN